MVKKRRTAAGPTRIARRLPIQLPRQQAAAIGRARLHTTTPLTMKTTAPAKFEARLSTLEVGGFHQPHAQNPVKGQDKKTPGAWAEKSVIAANEKAYKGHGNPEAGAGVRQWRLLAFFFGQQGCAHAYGQQGHQHLAKNSRVQQQGKP